MTAVIAALAIVFFAATSRPERSLLCHRRAGPDGPRSRGLHRGDSGPRPTQPAAEPKPRPKTVEREAGADPTTGEHPIVWVKPGRRVVLRDAPGGDPVAKVGDETDFGSPSVFSVVRHTDTWVAAPSPEMPDGEPAWIKADPRKLLGGYVAYSVRVDLSERRAELLHHGVVIRRWPVTIGAPGTETPTGTFAVTDMFRGGLNPATAAAPSR